MTEANATVGASDIIAKDPAPAEKVNGVAKGSPDQPEKALGDDGIETAKAVIAAPSDVPKGSDTENAALTTPAGDSGKSEANTGAEQSAAATPEVEASSNAPVAATSCEAPEEPKAVPVGDAALELASEAAQIASPTPATPAEDAPAAAMEEPASTAAVSVEAVAEVSAEPKTAEQQDGNGPAGADARNQGAEENGVVAPLKEAVAVTPPGTVQELSRRLSSTSLQGQGQATTPSRSSSSSTDRQHVSVVAAAYAAASGGRSITKSPSGNRSGEVSPASAHDTKNTINVSQLLKKGEFAKQPFKDFVPYAELQRLRVEDGIDATRKEDYLSDTDFKDVFGMDRDTFKKQPAWRQAQAKKKANLF